MPVKKLIINKTTDDDDCYRCEELARKKGMTQAVMDSEHQGCHGWYHCGPECCGSCMFCGG